MLRRILKFYNFDTREWESWFPLKPNESLGFDFTLLLAHNDSLGYGEMQAADCCHYSVNAQRAIDAIDSLAETRTTELKQVRQRLIDSLEDTSSCVSS